MTTLPGRQPESRPLHSATRTTTGLAPNQVIRTGGYFAKYQGQWFESPQRYDGGERNDVTRIALQKLLHPALATMILEQSWQMLSLDFVSWRTS
jgi:hypothetical protein